MTQATNADRNLADLLSKCALQDQAAFESLYKLTSAKLFAVVGRIVKRTDWAEEILQESFVKIWHYSAAYQTQKSAPMTWMTHIVRNHALDWLRRPQHEVVIDDVEMEALWVDPAAGVYEQLSQHQESQVINECLRQIEAKNRQAIALAFWQGLSHTELAQHLQQPIGTVKAWVRRGLTVLKKCFEESQ